MKNYSDYAENHPFNIESFGNNVPSNAGECLAFLNEEGSGMNAPRYGKISAPNGWM